MFTGRANSGDQVSTDVQRKGKVGLEMIESMDEWMDGLIIEWTNERTEEQTNEWMNERIIWVNDKAWVKTK